MTPMRESARHGTHAGWAQHQRRHERPCDPCYRARQRYDAERRNIPTVVQADRARSQAQWRAVSELCRRHPEEYAALYAQAKTESNGHRDTIPEATS